MLEAIGVLTLSALVALICVGLFIVVLANAMAS